MKTENIPHITVCICTYKRPEMLKALLLKLVGQPWNIHYEKSIVVVDNDRDCSARRIVDKINIDEKSHIEYSVVSEPNIAQTRNAAVKISRGEFIAFIDDDEIPSENWLTNHLKTITSYNAVASLGPVMPVYKVTPPKWLIRGKFCERKRYLSGTELGWGSTRTGNVLLVRRQVLELSPPFDPSYGSGGEDVTFFRALAERGGRFVWCDEAPVYEFVPPERCRASYHLKRAFLQGAISTRYYRHTYNLFDRTLIVGKSFLAVIFYTISLPVATTRGFAGVLQVLIKSAHHFSRFLTALGLYKISKRTIS